MIDLNKDSTILDDFGFDGGRALQYPEASKGKRFVNYVIDYFVRLPFTALLSLTVSYFVLGLTPEEVFTREAVTPGERVLDLALYYLVVVLYFWVCEVSFRGASLAKLITGTRAVQIDGTPLRPDHALGRSLWRIVPFEPFSFLGDGPGWHDIRTGTKVVDIRQARR